MVHIYKNEGGLIALYRGIIPTVAGVAPYVSGFPALYALKNLTDFSFLGRPELYGLRVDTDLPHPRRRCESQRGTQAPGWCHFRGRRPNLHISFVSILPISDNPIMLINCSDVLRRRFQINTMSGMGYQYESIWDAVRVIVTEEGVRGLYKGIVPNLLKVAPSMASSWLSFELTRDLLLSLRDQN